MSDEKLTIEILNWDKYNPKRAQRTYTWLRLNNDIFHSENFFGLNSTEKCLWFLLLCITSKKNKAIIEVDVEYCSHILGEPTRDIKIGLVKFIKRSMITSDAVSLHSTTPNVTEKNGPLPLRDETRRDERDGTNETDERKTTTSGAKRSASAPRGCIPEFTDQDLTPILDQIRTDTQKRWIRLYSDIDWIKQELIKAVGYYIDNPAKSPKKPAGWSRAMTAWIDRAWKWKAKDTPGRRTSGAQARQNNNMELYKRHVGEGNDNDKQTRPIKDIDSTCGDLR